MYERTPNNINDVHNILSDSKIAQLKCNKTDLTDTTFLVPIRIDSPERKENIESLIKFTFLHFITNFIVLEADSAQRFSFRYKQDRLLNIFIEDKDKVFHRTKWINQLITLTETPYAAVWDADAIAHPEQIVKSVNKLRSKEAVLSFPYDGKFYSCDKVSCYLFRKLLNIEILIKRVPVMKLMHGYHSVGGAFIVNKDKYIEAGRENENIYGWGPEDAERVKRLEKLGLSVQNNIGPLFHLEHFRGQNSWFANEEIRKKNMKELLNTCATNY